MPRELPGFYWDEEKNRYFPLSMKPKPLVGYVDPKPPPQKLEHSRRSASTSDEPSRKRRRVEGGVPTFSALEKLRTSYGSATHRQRVLQYVPRILRQNGLLRIVGHFSDIYASSLSLTCGGTAYPAISNGHITSLCAVVSMSHSCVHCGRMPIKLCRTKRRAVPRAAL